MKKKYISPELELSVFEHEDILTASATSFGINADGNTWVDI